MNIVVLGLSITSSWGNGHATTYRALLRELHALGHQILFLERDCPWYAEHRDLSEAAYCEIQLYDDPRDLHKRFAFQVAEADCVIVGSYVPDGIAVAEWAMQVATGVTAFYDIDTPVTVDTLAKGTCEYLLPSLISRFDLYLSFTGGPMLRMLKNRYGARHALPLYCSVDPLAYGPTRGPKKWDIGYLGTYSADRDAAMRTLLLERLEENPKVRGVVAGSMYPPGMKWPQNVERIEHLPPQKHAEFYSAQHFTLNLTRAAMIRAGYSPSVRLFEAAACGIPIITDSWPGLETILEPGREILVAESGEDVMRYLRDLSLAERAEIGERARSRVLREHTAAHRARQLESIVKAAQTQVDEGVVL
jgi:spore maturation protein CgeB